MPASEKPLQVRFMPICLPVLEQYTMNVPRRTTSSKYWSVKCSCAIVIAVPSLSSWYRRENTTVLSFSENSEGCIPNREPSTAIYSGLCPSRIYTVRPSGSVDVDFPSIYSLREWGLFSVGMLTWLENWAVILRTTRCSYRDPVLSLGSNGQCAGGFALSNCFGVDIARPISGLATRVPRLVWRFKTEIWLPSPLERRSKVRDCHPIRSLCNQMRFVSPLDQVAVPLLLCALRCGCRDE